MISPTLALDAQIPISKPLPFLGNQLLKMAKLIHQPADWSNPLII